MTASFTSTSSDLHLSRYYEELRWSRSHAATNSHGYLTTAPNICRNTVGTWGRPWEKGQERSFKIRTQTSGLLNPFKSFLSVCPSLHPSNHSPILPPFFSCLMQPQPQPQLPSLHRRIYLQDTPKRINSWVKVCVCDLFIDPSTSISALYIIIIIIIKKSSLDSQVEEVKRLILRIQVATHFLQGWINFWFSMPACPEELRKARTCEETRKPQC